MLIDAAQLQAWLKAGDCLVFDCRFALQEPKAGRRAWLAGHVPGALHVDLDLDLAGPVGPGTGRHPLPSADAFAGFLARSGWSPGRRVVAYDAQGGALAVRLWWLMRHFGHDQVLLLDGGFPAWLAAGLPVETGEVVARPAAPVKLHQVRNDSLDADAVQAGLARHELALLDARDAGRFAGRVEPIDSVAGHVPGALNRPFSANLAANGTFKPAAQLAAEFTAALGNTPPAEVAHMCGSGVTACHNLFAMELAGLSGSRLFPGSWSEWIRDSQRPVATGEA